MNKKIFTKHLRPLALLCLIFLGITNAWGADETVAFGPNWNTLFGTSYSGSISSVKANSLTLTGTIDGVTFTAKNGSSTSGYVKDSDFRAYNYYTITITAPTGKVIKTITSTKGGKTFTSGISADNGKLSISNNTINWTGSNNSVKLTCSGTVSFATITVTYGITSDNQAAAPTLTAAGTFTTTSYDVTITNNEEGATVFYTTDGTTPDGTSSSFTGASKTLSISATTTVNARAYISSKDSSDVVSATYTKEASIANTQATAYTVAQAINLIDGGSSQLKSTRVYVTGYVSEVTSYNSTYGSLTYYISDTQGTSKDFQIYGGLNSDSTKFAGTTDLTVGDSVTVYGLIKKYSTTYEMDLNNILKFRKTTATKTTPTISATYKSTLTVGGSADSYAVTYDGDGTLSVNSSSETVATAVLDGTTVTVTPVAAGTTTITISASETETYYSAKKEYTLTVISPAALPFSFDGGLSDIASTQGMSQEGLGSYDSSPKLKFDGTGDNLVINYAESAKYVAYTVKGNSFSGGTFVVLESADGSAYTSLKSYTTLGDAQKDTVIPNASSRFVKFLYTKKGNGNVALGSIFIQSASALDDAKLKFEKDTYTFTTTESKYVKATSVAGSTGDVYYSTEDENITLDGSTGQLFCTTAGTYTIKAVIQAVTGFKADTTTCTVKIVEPVTPNSVIIAESAGKYYAMTTELTTSYFGSAQVYPVNGKYVFTGENKSDILWYTKKSESLVTILNPTTKQYVQATAAKKVSYCDSIYSWTVGEDSILTAANTDHGTLQYNVGSPRFTTYANKTGQYAYIKNSELISDGYTRLVTKGNWGTICLPNEINAADMAGAKFYSITGKKTDGETPESIILTEETGNLVAGRPYFFKATADTLVVAYSSTSTETSGDYNGLFGSLYGTAGVNIGYYILSNNKLLKVDTDNFICGANRAYVVFSSINDVPSAKGDVEIAIDSSTGIEEISLSAILSQGKDAYNVSGQKVGANYKGIVIVNGKKYINK